MPIFNLNNQEERNEYAMSDAEKAAKNFEIKITGEGTKSQIIHSLYDLIRSMEANTDEQLDGVTLEDPVLCTEIKES